MRVHVQLIAHFDVPPPLHRLPCNQLHGFLPLSLTIVPYEGLGRELLLPCVQKEESNCAR
jgi:hypothetical protein